MEMTQQDFEDRLDRLGAGEGDDEDRRLVKLYRREGYQRSDTPADGSWLAGQQAAADDKYADMRYPELQALARKRHLNAGGSSAELIERLREHDAKTAANEE